MKKKFSISMLTVITAMVMLFSCVANAARPIKVLVGGEKIESDVAPIIVEDRTMLPVRAVFEAIGAKVDYVAEEQKVIATKGDITVEFVINSNVMKINGEEKELDVPAMIKDDRTLVPIRACAEAFDLKVDWNGNTNTVRIKKSVSLESETNIAKYTYDENGNKVYAEYFDGAVTKYTYDENSNMVYSENSTGFWRKYTYDENGNMVYSENSKGFWEKYAYDENGNEIYYEDSSGYWVKHTYDENGNKVYGEDVNGGWAKFTYDENGNEIYYENSNGYWVKNTYDENGNKVYYENSNGDWIKYIVIEM